MHYQQLLFFPAYNVHVKDTFLKALFHECRKILSFQNKLATVHEDVSS